MKVLVTGGAGYIGTHTCIELLEAGHDVIVVDNLSNSKYEAISRVEKITNKKVKFYEVDLLNKNALEEIFQVESFDSVIHFAGSKAVGESVRIPLSYYHNNITGTVNLLDLMSSYNVKNIIFSSSATVYGLAEKVPLTEDSPLSTTSPYGTTKLVIEWILRDLYHADNKFNIIILRYFNPVGAHKSGLIGEDPKGIPNNLVPYVSQVAIGKLDEVSVYGNNYDTKDGTGVRDYIHVVDLAVGHVKALNHLVGNGLNIYNLGTGIGISVLEMIKTFEKISGKKVAYNLAPRRDGDIATCYADSSKALNELGFSAQKKLEDMCKDTWRWQQQNPNGYES